MKKLLFILVSLTLVLTISNSALAAPKNDCATIRDGTIYDPLGDVIENGFNDWGYNYRARMFRGKFCDAYYDDDWCQEWSDDNLAMKWNAAWLDNKDCDHDGELDRHSGFDSYIGSGAWLTNHQSGSYIDETSGETCDWFYYTKIVAVPVDAVEIEGIWYSADGIEIGPSIWEEFAIVQEVSNDPCDEAQGVDYLSPEGPGLGKF